jgi:arylsulfatase
MLSQFGNVTPEFVENIQTGNSDLEKMGTQESFIAYGKQWGQAAMAPFREHKAMTEEGGVKSPAFITGPGIKGGRIVDGVLSVRDIMPTTLDISGVSHDVGGVSSTGELAAPQALSWVPILNGSTDSVRGENDPLAWELFFRRGLRLGDWKAVYRSDNMGLPGPEGAIGVWRLYNLRTDPGESTDVRAENPEAFARVMEAWKIYAEENGVVTLDSGPSPQ